MKMVNRDVAIRKITEMPKEQVAKVLIFMAGMEAEHSIKEQSDIEPTCATRASASSVERRR